MKREVYDYMAGKADVYKGVKETGYEGFTKAMENGDYRKRVYDALKATGAWTYDYETFDKSWNAPEQSAAGAGETGAVNGDVEPVLDINSTRILGAEDFERYDRWKILGYRIVLVPGVLYHLTHPRGKNSCYYDTEHLMQSEHAIFTTRVSSAEELRNCTSLNKVSPV